VPHDPPRPDELDPVIHERVRLSIASILAARREVEYLELRDLLGVTDGNLAAHVGALERAGYVAVQKGFVGKKTRTTYRLTAAGRRAFEAHVERLLRLLGPAPEDRPERPRKKERRS
jgi:DNA-binding MarR family transcriptional regulator